VSIGEALAQARREAGLSVSQVSQKTRIREAIIRDIERDDYAACGGDFYARGHIRAIARAAGADSEPLIRQYDAARQPAEEQEPTAESGPGELARGEFGQGEFGPDGFGRGEFARGEFGRGEFGPDGFAAPDFGQDEFDAGDHTRGDYPRGEYPRGEYPRGEYPRGEYPRGDYLAEDLAAPDGFGPGEPEAPEEITSPHPVITTSQIAALEDMLAPHSVTAPEAGTAQQHGRPPTPGQPRHPDPSAAPLARDGQDPAAAATSYGQDPAATAPYRQDPDETASYRQDPDETASYRQDPAATARYRQDPAATAPCRQDPAATAPYRQGSPAIPSHRRDPAGPGAPYRPDRPVPGRPRRPELFPGTTRHRPDWLGILASVLMLALIGGGIYVLIPGAHAAPRSRPAAAGPARHGQAHHGQARHQGGQPAARQSSPAAPPGSTPGASSAGTQRITLTPARAVAFGPGGPAHGDNPQDASLAIDGRPTTAWQTDWYTTSHFGNLQSGTGLLLDMGHPVTVTSVEVTLGGAPGAGLQVRIGDVAALGALHPVARVASARGVERLRLASPAHGRYVLIWFTSLPPDSAGTYRASVYNVRVRGTGA
jgi:hypothetical protein